MPRISFSESAGASSDLSSGPGTSLRSSSKLPVNRLEQPKWLRNLCIDAFDESRSIGVGPVGMLRFEFGADVFSGIIGRYALAFQRKRSFANFGDQIPFRRHQRTIPRSAVVRQHMGGVEVGNLVQHRKPARTRAAVAIDVRHSLVLHYVTRD